MLITDWKWGVIIAALFAIVGGYLGGKYGFLLGAGLGILYFIWVFVNIPTQHKGALVVNGARKRIGPEPERKPDGTIIQDSKGQEIIPPDWKGVTEGWYITLLGKPFMHIELLDCRQVQINLPPVEEPSKDNVIITMSGFAMFRPDDPYDILNLTAVNPASGSTLVGIPAVRQIYEEIGERAQRAVIADHKAVDIWKENKGVISDQVEKIIEEDVNEKDMRLGGTTGLLRIQVIRLPPELEALFQRQVMEPIEREVEGANAESRAQQVERLKNLGVSPDVAMAGAMGEVGKKGVKAKVGSFHSPTIEKAASTLSDAVGAAVRDVVGSKKS